MKQLLLDVKEYIGVQVRSHGQPTAQRPVRLLEIAELLNRIDEFSANIEKPLTYAIGDVVVCEHQLKYQRDKKEQIITGVSEEGGDVEYSVNGCSWYLHEDMEFVRRADKKSLSYAVSLNGSQD